jgi:hypothetical protein
VEAKFPYDDSSHFSSFEIPVLTGARFKKSTSCKHGDSKKQKMFPSTSDRTLFFFCVSHPIILGKVHVAEGKLDVHIVNFIFMESFFIPE